MKKNRIWMSALALGLMAGLTQCKNGDKVSPDDENELITTIQLVFTPERAGPAKTFTYRDVDGDGGNPPTKFDTISLDANTGYVMKMIVLDESKNPTDDITKKIEAKKDEHLFIFTSDPASLLSVVYTDQDSRNLPVGLKNVAVTKAPGMGKLRVQLRHQPPINGKAQKDGTPSPGSDDVNLNFNLKVK